jgi:hypothetical protein
MKNHYLSEKELKKKSTKQGLVVLFIFIVIFLAVILRFAIRADNGGFSSLPGSGDAYQIAVGFIKPTIKSPTAQFPDRDFECAKTGDSVYTVKSYFETDSNNGRSAKTDFAITLKYNGGSWENEKSWTMVKLEERP